MLKRLQRIFKDVFGFEADSLEHFMQASVQNVESWDSFAHINLILELEEEFGVVIGNEATEMLSIKEIIVELTAKGVQD